MNTTVLEQYAIQSSTPTDTTARQENGNCDRRLLASTLAAWAASLSAHLMFDAVMGTTNTASSAVDLETTVFLWVTSNERTLLMCAVPVVSLVVIALAVSAMVVIKVRCGGSSPARYYARASTVVVPVCAALIAGTAAWCADTMIWHDPASVSARDGPVLASAAVHITNPPVVSDRYDADCQVDVAIRSLTVNGVTYTSISTARLYATDNTCSILQRDAQILITGTLQQAEFGAQALWLTVDSDDMVDIVHEPGRVAQVVTNMQESFFDVCDRLSDQGRVLVPGLTLGVLGQDHIATGTNGHNSDGSHSSEVIDDADTGTDTGIGIGIGIGIGAGTNAADSADVVDTVDTDDAADAVDNELDAELITPIDDTYASLLEQRFRLSGIMHLMAVSGGHFVVVAGLIRRLCALILAHRVVVAIAMACGYWGLASLMYPSDSVLRALVMGMIGVISCAVGRRSQGLTALCWTALAVLVVTPHMSESFGFSLSCAAVLGIILFTNPLCALLTWCCPQWLAEPVSITVAAQTLTLPIQILMEPQLPLMSVPANLLVSPVVGASTLMGLASLLISTLSSDMGFALAWLASCGTLVMERCATWLADGEHAVLPWADGVLGAVLIIVAEMMVCTIVITIRRISAHYRAKNDGQEVTRSYMRCSKKTNINVYGKRWNPITAWYERVGLWWSQTATIFRSWTTEDS